ncbi:MAG: tetratricopeptide repeat protein [Pseudomonadota bacterium]
MDLFRTLKARNRDARTAPDRRALVFIEQGNSLERAGEFDSALQAYEAAVREAPNWPRAHLNHGNVLLAMGDAPGCLAAYERALTHDPNYVGAHFNLGNAYLRMGRLDAALNSYVEAVRLDREFADAHVAIGCVLEDLGRVQEAIASYELALAIEPGYAPVHSNLANALKRASRFCDAVQSHRRALELDPSLVQAHNNLGNALQDLGQLDEAEDSYRRALALKSDDVDTRSNLLFSHNYRAKHPPAVLFAEAKAFGDVVALGARRYTAWRGTPDPSRCLRVGLVSGDLRGHPVGYFLESVVAALKAEAANRLQLIAYPTTRCDDSTAERIKTHCREWHPVQDLSDEALARRIHDDAIDILIDLSGHTAHNRLPVFAWKPSPLQINWLGYFATTGVAEIDYLIADPWTVPESQAAYFTEKIWRLPETRLCFTPPDSSPAPDELPAMGGAVLTFACFNNLTKVGDAVIAVWARVLAAVPASRLLLKSPQLGEAQVRERIVAGFARHGIDADRLVLEGLTPRFDYLAAYRRVDIALDPFPFTGGTTTAESLWMGVPVLTLAGESFLSRQGVGLLMNAGLHDWIANDVDQYVSLAVAHAADLDRLAALRKSLRRRLIASPIMDARRFAGHFEAALRAMWQQWCGTHGPHRPGGGHTR